MDQDHKTDEIDVETDYDNIWIRLLNMIIIAVLMSMASTLLGIMTVAQFLIMLFNDRQPHAPLAEMGTTMGVWMAKAARYQTGASEVKPWPWTELD